MATPGLLMVCREPRAHLSCLEASRWTQGTSCGDSRRDAHLLDSHPCRAPALRGGRGPLAPPTPTHRLTSWPAAQGGQEAPVSAVGRDSSVSVL